MTSDSSPMLVVRIRVQDARATLPTKCHDGLMASPQLIAIPESIAIDKYHERMPFKYFFYDKLDMAGCGFGAFAHVENTCNGMRQDNNTTDDYPYWRSRSYNVRRGNKKAVYVASAWLQAVTTLYGRPAVDNDIVDVLYHGSVKGESVVSSTLDVRL